MGNLNKYAYLKGDLLENEKLIEVVVPNNNESYEKYVFEKNTCIEYENEQGGKNYDPKYKDEDGKPRKNTGFVLSDYPTYVLVAVESSKKGYFFKDTILKANIHSGKVRLKILGRTPKENAKIFGMN